MRKVFYVLFVLTIFLSIGSSKEIVKKSVLPADSVVIDKIAEKNKLEMPSVTFFHDKHTNYLNQKGKSCKDCHIVDKNKKLTLKFIESLEIDGSKELKEKYHNKCLDCHRKQTDKDINPPKEESCRVCHNANYGNKKDAKWKTLNFDKDLHTSHIKSNKLKSTNPKYSENCYLCHRSYDEKTGKTFYEKGKEESCKYCHLANKKNEKFKGKVDITKKAYHTLCLSCHTEKIEKEKLDLPQNCSSCHISQKFDIKKVDYRIKKNQKDISLMNSFSEKENKKLGIEPVPFNHKNHEKNNKNCISCHHKSLEKCSNCHTQKGAKKGDYINLSAAMHKVSESERSCIGCHNKQKEKKECVGCHTLIPPRKEQNYKCADCHKKIPSNLSKNKNLKKEAIAKTLLNKKPRTFDIKDIPKKVKIKKLERNYEAVILPHRKIVKSLMKNIKGNELAEKFHSYEETVCKACHHNTQIKELKPPACVSCHTVSDLNNSTSFSSKEKNRPNLKAAYHNQCMECHKSMKLEKPISTDCNSCHKKK